jgi:hypothetical protein
MSVDLEAIWKLFRNALAALSLPAEEQRRVNRPGCLACDLLCDFNHSCATFLAHFADVLTDGQRAAIAGVESAVCELQDDDLECWNDEILVRPAWNRVRAAAGNAVREFGYSDCVVPPFVETEPGVWRRTH